MPDIPSSLSVKATKHKPETRVPNYLEPLDALLSAVLLPYASLVEAPGLGRLDCRLPWQAQILEFLGSVGGDCNKVAAFLLLDA